MWVKVDDQFPDHPKVAAAGPVASWVFICGLCYCNRMLTDGFIPVEQVHKFVPHSQERPDDPSRLAERLVQVGLWTEDERRGIRGYLIHDYLKFQPSRKQVLAERSRGAKRQAAWRHKRNGNYNGVSNGESNGEDNAGSHEKSNGARNGPVTMAPYPDPDPLKDQDRLTHRACARDEPARQLTRTVLEPIELIRWFDKVYGAYPNKDRKVEANRAWVELGPDLETAHAILGDVRTRVDAGWKRYERRFIPKLATYLAERMWEDANEGAQPVYEDTIDVPHAWHCSDCGEVHEGTAAQARAKACLRKAS